MVVHLSDRENFFHQIVANLPPNATGIVRFLKTFSKTLKFSIIGNCGKIFVEYISNSIIPQKCLFTLFKRFFLAKNQKIFEIGKIRIHEETEYFEKKNAFIF